MLNKLHFALSLKRLFRIGSSLDAEEFTEYRRDLRKNPDFEVIIGGTCYRVMTSILLIINWVKIESLHFIRSDLSLFVYFNQNYSLCHQLFYSDIFNIKLFHFDLIHF